MCVRIINFSPFSQNSPQVSEKLVRTFGQAASLCDYEARKRIITFVSKDSVGVYKFDETF